MLQATRRMTRCAEFEIFQVRYIGILYIMYVFKVGNVLYTNT
jgi:hypothetical protein